jgi:hypothetical protein
MITSTSSTDHAGRMVTLPATTQVAARSNGVRADQLSTQNAAALRAALANQPEIRPEVVARARALAADPSYPPLAIMRSIAQQIVASPDLSEDAS